jgi:dTDP-4-dehydrorhamnose 3,5-epimerase
VNVVKSPLEGVLIFEPKVFKDDRGHFLESFHAERYRSAGLTLPFVQDNWSRSKKGTLRGLHFQNPRPQGKLVMVTRGAVFDVAVDIRKSSPTFGKWFGLELSEENCKQLWIPPGFAHGFVALKDDTDFLYKCTDVYFPEGDGGVLWSDPDIGITWPVQEPLLSKKDASAPRLRDSTKLPA